MKSPNQFNLSKEQKDDFRSAIQAYFLDELETEIGDLQADFFIEFLNQKVGKYYYNLGVTDSIQLIKEKSDDLVLLVKD